VERVVKREREKNGRRKKTETYYSHDNLLANSLENVD
jgi:hypothetical protein